jgi:DNA anti-recombination protein RmuC
MMAFRNADTDHSGPHFDPWANYNHQKASQPQPRDTAGPTEARFQEHAARLQDHNEKLTKMEAALTKLQTDTKNEFMLVQKREQQNQMQMHAAIATVKTELESSFQHAINQQSHQLNSTLGELRQLLQAKPKRNRAADDDDMSG